MCCFLKISIITLHRVYNYGSVLQAYATQKIFENYGHNVEVIDYITPQRTKRKIYWGNGAIKHTSNVKRFMYRVTKLGSIFLKEQTFGKFLKKNLKLILKQKIFL